MSRIRSRDTTPELILRKALWAAGCRYRVNWRHSEAAVRIDIASPCRKVAVFVDGCFWHGCPQHAATPSSNTAFWTRKLAANKARDIRQTDALRAAGWRVVRVWEHDIGRDGGIPQRLASLWSADSHQDELRAIAK